MRAILIGFALATASLLVAPTPARAQIAAAIGKPLPSPDLPTGTIAVRVIAGSPTVPVVGTEVTLTVNGEPRAARTDAAGRAQFPGLTVGATVVASVKDEEGKDVTSDSFQVPDENGARVMITTKPFQPLGGGAAPFAGGQGMPQPRQLSGQPRPEAKDPPGTITVLVVFDELKDIEPSVPVTLVGYQWDGRITTQVVQTGKDGRAQFVDLDRSGGTAYYAMAQLARNGAWDRVTSMPIQLEPSVGVRLILSGEKRASTAPPVDDLSRFEQQNDVGAGKVRVSLRGLAVSANQIELVDADSGTVVAHALPEKAAADVSNVELGAEYKDRGDEPPGTFDITVHGGPRGTDQPMKDIEVRVSKASENPDAEAPIATSKTNESGKAHFDLGPGQYQVTLIIGNAPRTSQPFDLSKAGSEFSIKAQWDAFQRLQAVFDVAPQAHQTLFARTLGKGGKDDIYRSLPFQPVTDRGTTVSILIAPHVLFHFRMVSEVEDNLLAVRGLFEIENATWAPYKATADGLVIPLPKHFKGALVAENEAQIASVDANAGFRILKPLPPLRTEFHGGFSLPVDGGKLDWSLDLPYGAFQSNIRIVPFPGLHVSLPKNVKGGLVNLEDGQEVYEIPNISIDEGHSMNFSIEGLPSVPMWRIWVPRLFGGLVVMLIVGGVVIALVMRPRGAGGHDPTRATRRARLLDELVALDKAGGNKKRRDALVSELESLWD